MATSSANQISAQRLQNKMNKISQISPSNVTAPNIEAEIAWWKGAVIYQIYPRSFKDANGDGVGDLKGITANLDHVASLDVDAIWLSPFFKSPMDDYGYDISDYCDVDPIFGTLSDFDALITKAHALGLKVIIDQVYSHTSDQHAWFTQSRSARDNAKADWYVWADAKADGSPPSNWQAVFGGCSWEWDARRGQYYLHNFLTSQPDLNLHNPDVQAAILEVTRFWLRRGVDGFRLDALNFGMHDQSLTDNPPETVFKRAPKRPFDFQRHVNSMSQPGMLDVIERIRGVINEFGTGIFTVAEVGGPQPLAEMKAFTKGEQRLNSAYSFDFLYADNLTADLVKTVLADWLGESDEGWPSWAFSNHDAPRAVSRWRGECPQNQYAKLLSLLMMSLRGNAFIYQGEELGLPQADVPFEHLKDPEAITNWPETLGRDGARTPMPWDHTQNHCAGFSTSQPWLPMDERHTSLSVSAQNADENSVLSFTRAAIAMRRASVALRAGTLSLSQTDDDILAFTREYGGERILCVFNLGSNPHSFTPPKDAKELLSVGKAGSAHSGAVWRLN